jgi:1-acyl-sn-glycerol-3-phosphate acyltransferase
MIGSLAKLVSFQYNDRPMHDSVYELHTYWVKFLHDYYHRVEHVGRVKEVLNIARKENVVLISQHSITLEAVLINYFLFKNNAGKAGTLVYPEAFKLPLVRELFRSGQCVPISIPAGAATLSQRHILVFPEGMDFISGLANPDRVPRFHKGFLRMAKKFLEDTGKKSIHIIPIGHAGVENTLKLWVIKNQTLLDIFVRPFVDYPFLVLPKIPFLLPRKVIMNWGMPTKVTLEDLKNERKIAQKANYFRAALLALKTRAQKVREMGTAVRGD